MAISNAAVAARKDVRIGLLGCGFMGKCHTNAYKKIPYIYSASKINPRLAVLCDMKAELAEQEAARYGYEAFCSDWKELVALRSRHVLQRAANGLMIKQEQIVDK